MVVLKGHQLYYTVMAVSNAIFLDQHRCIPYIMSFNLMCGLLNMDMWLKSYDSFTSELCHQDIFLHVALGTTFSTVSFVVNKLMSF